MFLKDAEKNDEEDDENEQEADEKDAEDGDKVGTLCGACCWKRSG